MQPFYTTRGGAAPLFYKTCGEAAATTFGAKGPVNLSPLNHLNPLNLGRLAPYSSISRGQGLYLKESCFFARMVLL